MNTVSAFVIKTLTSLIYPLYERTVDNIKWGKLKSGKGWINLADTQKK